MPTLTPCPTSTSGPILGFYGGGGAGAWGLFRFTTAVTREGVFFNPTISLSSGSGVRRGGYNSTISLEMRMKERSEKARVGRTRRWKRWWGRNRGKWNAYQREYRARGTAPLYREGGGL